MKILHITTIDATAYLFLLPILKGLRAKGHDVTLATAPGPFTERIRREGIGIFPVRISRRLISLWDITACLRLWRHIVREKYDLVHTHTAKAGFVGRLAAQLA
ncbi:MAG: glycosyltransferase, partial [Armatimonadetes bacterium]|nr:glycosyltransferase [Armatimonadota bacterium]